MFIQGQAYNRTQLQNTHGGQSRRGISTPARHNFIMLFTEERGTEYGYDDGWSADGLFLCSGEGPSGGMQFVRGNRAIRDHAVDGKDLHLFEHQAKGLVRYIDQMVSAGHRLLQGPDADGNERQLITFELMRFRAIDRRTPSTTGVISDQAWRQPLTALRRRATATPSTGATPSERLVAVYARSDAVKVYVLRRADGQCESCGLAAPFQTESGRPYLETHHIRRLSDGGPDHPRWVIAVCPNCHRRAHYSSDAAHFNSQWAHVVGTIERPPT